MGSGGFWCSGGGLTGLTGSDGSDGCGVFWLVLLGSGAFWWRSGESDGV